MSVSVHVHYVRIPIEHQPKAGPYYEPVPIKHHLPDGAWRLPRHLVYALGRHPDTGRFDPQLAGHLVGNVLFPNATLIHDNDDVLIPRETVAALGHGDIEAGQRVLDQWHDRLVVDALNDAVRRHWGGR
jgi:hypothetical protein